MQVPFHLPHIYSEKSETMLTSMFKQKTYRVATIYQYKKSQDISAPDTVQYVAVWKYPGALVFYISFRKFLLKSLFLDM